MTCSIYRTNFKILANPGSSFVRGLIHLLFLLYMEIMSINWRLVNLACSQVFPTMASYCIDP